MNQEGAGLFRILQVMILKNLEFVLIAGEIAEEF